MLDQFKKTILPILKQLAKLLTPEVKRYLLYCSIVLAVSLVSANILASLSLPYIMKSAISNKKSQDNEGSDKRSPFRRPNFRDIRKAIEDRNVFNLDGEFPDESVKEEDSSKEAEQKPDVFDESAPCRPSKLGLSLLGTIYLGDNQFSSALVKESGVDDSDVYRQGDYLIGKEGVQIVGILRNKIILNNDGVKECIEILVNPKGFENPSVVTSETQAAADSQPSVAGPVILQASWVESELGDGFGKIIASARFVPNTQPDGTTKGFKIFNISGGSLLDKVGFRDGDVVLKVNETDMTPEQGFALYQAFLDEKEIAIQLLRAGTNPMTINVSIK